MGRPVVEVSPAVLDPLTFRWGVWNGVGGYPAAAILILVVNLIGYGFGPPVIGWLSDTLAAGKMTAAGLSPELCHAAAAKTNALCGAATADGLRTAMQIGCLVFLWAGLHFLLAWRSLRRDWHAEA